MARALYDVKCLMQRLRSHLSKVLRIVVLAVIAVQLKTFLALPKQTDLFLDTSTATSTETKSRDRSRIREPTLYLHVGPPKTATTAIQCALCANTGTPSLLAQDNLVYLGTCPSRPCGLDELPPGYLPHRFKAFFSDLQPSGAFPSATGALPVPANYTAPVPLPPLAPLLQRQLEQAYAANQNALIVFEGMHRFHLEWLSALQDYLLQNNKQRWNVHVTVAYRRLYEWLPSKYNSLIKLRASRTAWPDGTNNSNKNKRDRIEPFSLDGTEVFHKIVQQIERTTQQHPTETVARNYRHFFDTVNVWNIHDSSPQSLVQDFFCRIRAHHACRAEEAFSAKQRYNPSPNLDYDRLAVAAHDVGLVIPANASRRHVSRALESFLQNETLPRLCLAAPELRRLEALSQQVETSLYEFLQEDPPSDHRKSFEEYQSKLCWMNVEEALNEDVVQKFLRQYGKNNTALDGGVKD